MELAKSIYMETGKFPADERFGITGQMRCCAVSVPSNIDEGACRGSRKEFTRSLMIARGSLGEMETQCFLAKDLGYLNEDVKIFELTGSVFRLICGLIRSLNQVSP